MIEIGFDWHELTIGVAWETWDIYHKPGYGRTTEIYIMPFTGCYIKLMLRHRDKR